MAFDIKNWGQVLGKLSKHKLSKNNFLEKTVKISKILRDSKKTYIMFKDSIWNIHMQHLKKCLFLASLIVIGI